MGDYLEHITTSGERWDLLAWHYYGDPLAYGIILDANPDVRILSVLPAGVALKIPLIAADDDAELLAPEDLPPWKQ